MKKIVVSIIAMAFLPLVSMGFNNSITDKSHDQAEEIKSNDDWTPIGTTEISKKVGTNAMANQTVQVYQNSEGTRAIKDGRYYREIEENPTYGRFPSDECLECGYRYRVFYEGSFWYTHNVVKQTYGSY